MRQLKKNFGKHRLIFLPLSTNTFSQIKWYVWFLKYNKNETGVILDAKLYTLELGKTGKKWIRGGAWMRNHIKFDTIKNYPL